MKFVDDNLMAIIGANPCIGIEVWDEEDVIELFLTGDKEKRMERKG